MKSLKEIQIYLDKHNMQLNPNTEIVEAIQRRLVATKGYCPCRQEQNPDTICPCKTMREEGHCCCTLYVKKTE